MNKTENYKLLIAQLQSLLAVKEERNVLSNLANSSALLKESLPNSVFSGYYLFDGEKLVLGPFQGKVSCVNIDLGKGVCGESAASKETLIIEDTKKHENYIACDSQAKSEIVVPMIKDNQLLGVLDLDSRLVDDYDEVDKKYLEEFVSLLLDLTDWNFEKFEVLN